MKRTYDLRGKQASIARLLGFDMEAFVHMIAYRLLIFASIIYGIALLLAAMYPQFGTAVVLLTAIVWILYTVELFEFIKGIAMVQSKGLVFGRFLESYREIKLRDASRPMLAALSIAPYAAVAVWAAGLVAMLIWWH